MLNDDVRKLGEISLYVKALVKELPAHPHRMRYGIDVASRAKILLGLVSQNRWKDGWARL